jgi:hypothetical protein
MLNHLQEEFGGKSHRLRWGPDLLTDELGPKRKEFARQMIPSLGAATRDSWGHFVTGEF